MNEPTNEPVNEPVNEPTNEPSTEPTHQHVEEPASKENHEPVSEPAQEVVQHEDKPPSHHEIKEEAAPEVHEEDKESHSPVVAEPKQSSARSNEPAAEIQEEVKEQAVVEPQASTGRSIEAAAEVQEESKEAATSARSGSKGGSTPREGEAQRKKSEEPPVDEGPNIDEAVLERKRESFVNFQNIEQQRRGLVESHRAILINMVTNVDSKLQWIDTGVEKAVQFFKDRAQQEENYLKVMAQGLQKLGPSFKDAGQPDLFVNLSRALEECDEFHLRQSQNGELLVKFLRRNILEGIVLAAEKEFRTKLEVLITPLEEMKKKLTNLQQDRLKKLKNYVYSYNEAQRGNKITKDKDMFKHEIENLSLGYEELRIMKEYAAQALLLVNETVKMLVKRFLELQKAFDLYFNKYSELYGSKAANPDGAIQLVQRFNSFDEVQHAFTTNNLLKAEDLLYIKQKSGKIEVTYQEVFDVLVNLPNPPDITRSPLVIKEWKAQRDAGLLKGYKPCSVVITVDSNILVLEKSPEGEVVVTDNILKLQNLKIMPADAKKDGSIVDIMEVIPGLILDSKKKVTLKFDNLDGAEEFRHYLYNYYSTTILQSARVAAV